jgi:hypothetical protein
VFNQKSSSSDEENGEDEAAVNGDNMDVEQVEQTKDKLSKEDSENFEKMEEGWTLVSKSGKHLTK